jgi:hypothetical protein
VFPTWNVIPDCRSSAGVCVALRTRRRAPPRCAPRTSLPSSVRPLACDHASLPAPPSRVRPCGGSLPRGTTTRRARPCASAAGSMRALMPCFAPVGQPIAQTFDSRHPGAVRGTSLEAQPIAWRRAGTPASTGQHAGERAHAERFLRPREVRLHRVGPDVLHSVDRVPADERLGGRSVPEAAVDLGAAARRTRLPRTRSGSVP